MNHGAGNILRIIKRIYGIVDPIGTVGRHFTNDWNPWNPEGPPETKPISPPKPPKPVQPPKHVTPKRTNLGRNSA